LHFFLCKSSSHPNKYITGTLNKGQPLHRGKGRNRGRKGRGKGRGKERKGKGEEGEKVVIVDVVHISTFDKDVLKKC
jgi:hypothetical protein